MNRKFKIYEQKHFNEILCEKKTILGFDLL